MSNYSYDLELDQKLGNETTTLVESYEVRRRLGKINDILESDGGLLAAARRSCHKGGI